MIFTCNGFRWIVFDDSLGIETPNGLLWVADLPPPKESNGQ